MIKNGVDLLGVSPQMVIAYVIAQKVYTDRGYDCIITSAVDGRHERHSHHRKGCAIDLRINNIPADILPEIVAKIKNALGMQFQVILESDHIHLEFDPRY